MTPAARLSAAIEVVADIEARRRPAGDALKDWGLAHRFAGSSDRAAIAGLVYDTLRRKSSSAWLMGEAGPRAAVIGMLHRERGLDGRRRSRRCAAASVLPRAVDAGGAGGTRPAIGSRTRRRRFSATIPTGSIRIFPASSAKTAPRRALRLRAARRSTCASIRSRPNAKRYCRSSRT